MSPPPPPSNIGGGAGAAFDFAPGDCTWLDRSAAPPVAKGVVASVGVGTSISEENVDDGEADRDVWALADELEYNRTVIGDAEREGM